MRRVVSALVGAGIMTFAPTGLAVPAAAGADEIVVFQHEFAPLTTYEDFSGCHKLPPDAHVLTNRTDKPVRIYADPFCMTPSVTVEPGHGSHVAPGSGSFSA